MRWLIAENDGEWFQVEESQALTLETANAFNGLDGLLTPASQRFHDKRGEGDTSSPAGPAWVAIFLSSPTRRARPE